MDTFRVIEMINTKFVYTTDWEQYKFYDVWVPLRDVGGRLLGDCEGYALTMKENIGGDVYFCKHEGRGHVVLRMSEYMYIDNIQKRLFNPAEFPEYTGLRKVGKIEMIARRTLGTVVAFIANTIRRIF